MNHASELALSVIAALVLVLAIALAPLLFKPRVVATPNSPARPAQVRSIR